MKAAVSKAVALRECPLGDFVKRLLTICFSYLTAKNPCVEVFEEGGTSHTSTQVIKS